MSADEPGVELDAAYRWAAGAVADRDVLVVGCGHGEGAALLLDAGARAVLGVDPDPESVRAATAAHGDRIRFQRADPAKLGVGDAAFEAIVCFGTLERSAAPDAIVAELRRALAPGGIALLSLPLAEPDGMAAAPGSPERPPSPASARIEPSQRTAERWLEVLAGSFARIEAYRRRTGVATAIETAPPGSTPAPPSPVARWLPGEPDVDPLLLVVAGDDELPRPTPVVSLSGDEHLHRLEAERARWEERARRAEAEGSAKHWELVAAREAQRRLRKRLHTLEHRPLRVLSRVIRRKPAKLGPGPPLRASEREREDWE